MKKKRKNAIGAVFETIKAREIPKDDLVREEFDIPIELRKSTLSNARR